MIILLMYHSLIPKFPADIFTRLKILRGQVPIKPLIHGKSKCIRFMQFIDIHETPMTIGGLYKL